MSCSRPNIQGLLSDKEYRKFVRAEDGNFLIKADFSQIKLRIAARWRATRY